MSDQHDGVTKEEEVVISEEDIKNVNDYFEHFSIDMPTKLAESLKRFKANPTLKNQKYFKLQMCNTIKGSKHESFQDEMFAPVKVTAEKARYELQFEFDVDDELGVDGVDKKKDKS